jgi:hypothetical protein
MWDIFKGGERRVLIGQKDEVVCDGVIADSRLAM